MNKENALKVALERFQELRDEEKTIKEVTNAQFGTQIPQLFGQQESFIANPSRVGTAVLSRMIDTDDAVSAAVQFKVLMILAKIGEYHHDDPEIKEFVNDYLKKMKGPTWPEALESMLSSSGFGFSISEIIWALNDKMQKVPSRVTTYHPSTMAFEVDGSGSITETGVIQFIMQNSSVMNPNNVYSWTRYGTNAKNPFETPTDRITPWRIPFMGLWGIARIPRNKCIHMVNLPMFSFGSPYGKTSVRTAHLAWGLKNFFMKQMGIAGKRNATNFIWGTAPHGTAKVKVPDAAGNMADKEVSPAAAMIEMLKNREADDSVVTGPENAGYKLSTLQNAASLDGFLAVINNLDVRIFRCFLIPSLVLTDGSAGNRALGDKHFQIVDRVCEEEAKKCTQTIVNDMIERSIIDNFGPQKDYGSFRQRPQNIEERERLSNLFSTLTNVGYMSPAEEEDFQYVRSAVHLPKRDGAAFDLFSDKKPLNDGSEDDEGDTENEKDPPSPGESPEEEITDSALNGAQVSSMVQIVKDVAEGNLPRESAIEIMKTAFNIEREQAEKILATAGNGFVPANSETPSEPSDKK